MATEGRTCARARGGGQANGRRDGSASCDWNDDTKTKLYCKRCEGGARVHRVVAGTGLVAEGAERDGRVRGAGFKGGTWNAGAAGDDAPRQRKERRR